MYLYPYGCSMPVDTGYGETAAPKRTCHMLHDHETTLSLINTGRTRTGRGSTSGSGAAVWPSRGPGRARCRMPPSRSGPSPPRSASRRCRNTPPELALIRRGYARAQICAGSAAKTVGLTEDRILTWHAVKNRRGADLAERRLGLVRRGVCFADANCVAVARARERGASASRTLLLSASSSFGRQRRAAVSPARSLCRAGRQ